MQHLHSSSLNLGQSSPDHRCDTDFEGSSSSETVDCSNDEFRNHHEASTDCLKPLCQIVVLAKVAAYSTERWLAFDTWQILPLINAVWGLALPGLDALV